MMKSGANDVQSVFNGTQHTKHKLFSHKALQSAVAFVSPRHLYTLACRTATLLLQGTIQDNWQRAQSSFCLIRTNMWLFPPQNVLILLRLNGSCMVVDCTVILLPHLTHRSSHQLFSLCPHILPLPSHSILSVMVMMAMMMTMCYDPAPTSNESPI